MSFRRTVTDRQMMAKLGERLKWVRQAKGMSQVQISSLVGCHQTTWSLYERGLRWPEISEIPRILAKLKISRGYLLDGTLLGVEPELAIRLAAAHPELVPPIDRVASKGSLHA